MKKILVFLIISVFIYQCGIAVAIDKNNSTSTDNTITKSGRITGISIEDK